MKHLKPRNQSHQEPPGYDQDDFPTNLLLLAQSYRITSFLAACVPQKGRSGHVLRRHSDPTQALGLPQIGRAHV